MTAALLLHRADGALPTTAFCKARLGPADPFARDREIAWEGPGAMSVGRIGFVGDVNVAHYPHTETLVVVEGELSLTRAGAAPLGLSRGAGAVIARGTALHIHAASRAQFVFCAAAAERANQPGITPLRADANFKPSNSLPPEVLLGPAPQCRSDNVFKDDLTGVQAGTWDSTPYHRIVRPHRVNEFMYLVDGGVRFASPDGSVLATQAGDAIFVPQGVPVGWESSERVAKFYVVQEVKA
jgi:uncharacterized cupin superfamily protein